MATLRNTVHGPTPLTRIQLCTLSSRLRTTQAICRIGPKDCDFMGSPLSAGGASFARRRFAARLKHAANPRRYGPEHGKTVVCILAWQRERGRCAPAVPEGAR